MKNLSALAVALSLGLASVVAMAPAADAATTAKKPAAACVATKTKPCPVKHVAHKLHKKHKIVAKAKTDTKAPAKKS